jgi:hypothetical protein
MRLSLPDPALRELETPPPMRVLPWRVEVDPEIRVLYPVPERKVSFPVPPLRVFP